MLCSTAGSDIYELLGRRPVRETVIYGGTIPLLSPRARAGLLALYTGNGITNLRVKADADAERTLATLDELREELGASFDLRIDANGSWGLETAKQIIPLLMERGIRIIEEPLGRDFEAQTALARAFPDIEFAADESFLTATDLEEIASTSSFRMLNIRLSKNGGLLRSLRFADLAERRGLRYQHGCHPGETGVLSAVGRVAASLMEAPVYSDGSYDRYLLTGNITSSHVSFGPGGRAPIIRGNGLGYRAEIPRLGEWSVGHTECI